MTDGEDATRTIDTNTAGRFESRCCKCGWKSGSMEVNLLTAIVVAESHWCGGW